MPLWPLIRTPAGVTVAIVVFCMAFVTARADASHGQLGYDCNDGTFQADAWSLTTPRTETDAVRLLSLICVYGSSQAHDQLAELTAIKELADVETQLTAEARDAARQTRDALLTDDDETDWLGRIDGRVDGLEGKLDTLHDDLVAVKASIDAQGPNGGGGGPNPACAQPEPNDCPDGTDADPQHVKLASSETQLEQAANAGTGALWFLAGLLALNVVAYALTRAAMPR